MLIVDVGFLIWKAMGKRERCERAPDLNIQHSAFSIQHSAFVNASWLARLKGRGATLTG
jgi:hypothetical protein